MKKIKQVIFFLAVYALLLITGNMDNGEISIKSAVILLVIDFVVIVWSGFSSGLLVVPDNERRAKYGKNGLYRGEN